MPKGKPKSGERGSLAPDDSPRKKFKITGGTTINKSAWQIKGEHVNCFNVFYIQKSLQSSTEEQPFLTKWLYKVDRNMEKIGEEMGVFYVGSRRDKETGEPMNATAKTDEPWRIFVANSCDVGKIQDWLNEVCVYMNSEEVAKDQNLFKYKPTFAVTSWGDATVTKKIQDVLPDNDVLKLLAAKYDLANPYNRMVKIEYDDYFHDGTVGHNLMDNFIAENF